MRHLSRRRAALVALLLVPLFVFDGCASAGTSDPLLVKAEDIENNSLLLFKTVVVDFHMKHSRTESPEVYRTLEKVRVTFPSAWASLNAAIPHYKEFRAAGPLLEKLAPVEALYDDLKRIWAGQTGAAPPAPTKE